MKKILLTLVMVLTTVMIHGQAFENGTTTANAGIGLGTALGGLGNARPALSVSVDHGLWDLGGPGVISLGGYIGNTGYKYDSGGFEHKWNYFVIGARGAYHFNGLTDHPKELDLYGGIMLAYNHVKYSSDGNNGFGGNYGSGIGFSGFIGGRWFFSDQFGAYAELGYGVSILNVGVTYKF